MSFTAKDVAKLREMTGAGMMNCKQALEETKGNIDEAVNYLRQKGIATAAKKAGNIAAEGMIAPEDVNLVSHVDSAAEAWNVIARFYGLH